MRSGSACAAIVLFSLTSLVLAAEPAPGGKVPPQGESRPQPPEAAEKGTGTRQRTEADRLDLDVSVVTGNRELPKVLYIVPWKKAELGNLPAQPFNSLLDEALKPIDRDVFRREVAYYSTLADRPVAAPAAEGKSSIAPTPSR
jgi:hypothetical protein